MGSMKAGLVALAIVLALAAAPAGAQQPPRAGAAQAEPPAQAEPAPPRPYKPVPVTLPDVVDDPSLDAFREELGAIAERKDRRALAARIARNFFWERGDGQPADPKKSGLDNLSAALNLGAKDGSGWEALAAFADDPNVAADPDRAGVLCGPALPIVDFNALADLAEATASDVIEWVYPAEDGLEVRAKPDSAAPVIDKLGMHLVRVLEDESQGTEESEDWVRVATPSGKVGYVPAESLLTLAGDQICYVKEGAAWKIAGIIGGGE